MSSSTRRALTIDDPVAGAAACHVARPTLDPSAGRLREISLEEIHPNADQPRKRFDQASLGALADSIRERGVLQPIIVQPGPTGGYLLIAGERRWRASRIAGRETIPALVDGAVDGAVSLELALIENVAREDLTVIEEARTIASLLDDLQVTTVLLARRLGRSRSDLAHTVRLLELPDEAIELLSEGALAKGHGKALLTEPNHHRRRELAERAAEGGWSVRALEAEIARASPPPGRRADPHPDQVAVAAKLQELLARATGCEIEARPYRLGYQLILDQNAVDRLTELLERGWSRSVTPCQGAHSRSWSPATPNLGATNETSSLEAGPQRRPAPPRHPDQSLLDLDQLGVGDEQCIGAVTGREPTPAHYCRLLLQRLPSRWLLPLRTALRRGVSVRPEMLVAGAEQVSRADHALSVRPTALPNVGAGSHLHEYSRFFFRNDDLSPDMSYEVLQDKRSRGFWRGSASPLRWRRGLVLC
jgi:ParB family transcriptional regulator, chromosome partitioning protein